MLQLFGVLGARFVFRGGRSVVSIIAIALGVSLAFGVHLVNQAAVDELETAVRASSGAADLQIRSGREGFAEELYARVALLPEVEQANPVLDAEVEPEGLARPIRITGIDPFRAAALHPDIFGHAPERIARLIEPDRVILSAAAASMLRTERGNRLSIRGPEGRATLLIADVLPEGVLHDVVILADIATVQWRAGRIGELSRIDIQLASGADARMALARIAPLLPAGVHVMSVDAAQSASSAPSRAYRVNLAVLSAVALFAGGFLVYSMMNLEMARRRSELALLRVFGLTRRQVAALIIIEAAATGLVGGAIGVAAGIAIATVALHVLGADLGAGMFTGLVPALRVSPLAAGLHGIAGVVVAVAGALGPVLAACRVPPAQGIRAGDIAGQKARNASPWYGVALFALGAVSATRPSVLGVPVFAYLAVACLLAGGIAVMPWTAQTLLRLAGPVVPNRSTPWSLALAQLRGSPHQTAVSLAAIVASFSLMVAMSIMVSSFRNSLDKWLDAVLPADLYFRMVPGRGALYLQSGFEREVRALPQVVRAEFQRTTQSVIDPQRPPISVLARDWPDGQELPRVPVLGPRYVPAPQDPPAVWVSEVAAGRYGFEPGQRIAVPLAGRVQEFVVGGVWRDYVRQNGAILMSRAQYVALTGDARISEGALWLAAGTDIAHLGGVLDKLAAPSTLEANSPAAIRQRSLAIFDRSFAITYVVEAVAVLVGLLGLASSLSTLVLARRREFGVLRHLGVARRQILLMLAAEGVMLAFLGAVVGLVTGSAISVVLIEVVNRQSFHWSMDLHVPAGMLMALAGTLIVLAAVTAGFAGRGSLSMAQVRAVREDW